MGLIIVITGLFIFWLGGVSHEADMARNFKKSGDAKAWFWEIKK